MIQSWSQCGRDIMWEVDAVDKRRHEENKEKKDTFYQRNLERKLPRTILVFRLAFTRFSLGD